MTEQTEIEMNEDKVAALEKKIAALEARLDPPPRPPHPGPHDYSANLRLPDAVAREMAKAGVDPQTLVRDFRKGPATPSSVLPSNQPQPTPAVKSSGWVTPPALGPQPGIGIIDRMCDAQDAKDRARR